MSRLLDGYRLNGSWHAPRMQVAALYIDQFPLNDQSREQAKEYGIPICSPISEDVQGVNGIAIIGEHGSYTRSARGNFMYPRWKHFDQPPPRCWPTAWQDGMKIYRRVRERHIPFMAGSTVPLSWQRPPLQFLRGGELEEVVGVSYSDLEEHAYHAVEMVQSVVELRKGGETGVAYVHCVEGPDVWNLDFSRELLEAALVRRKGASQPLAACFYIQLYNHNHWGHGA